MSLYVGTKIVSARPMTRAEYNAYRGWELPADEDGNDAGYLVEYRDGGKPNDARHPGYISWSPAEQFEQAYQDMGEVAHLQPHQQRVVGELTQLDDRIEKLSAFIIGSPLFNQLPADERDRLTRQLRLMEELSHVLSERVTHFF